MLIPNGKVENNFDCLIVIVSTDNIFFKYIHMHAFTFLQV